MSRSTMRNSEKTKEDFRVVQYLWFISLTWRIFVGLIGWGPSLQFLKGKLQMFGSNSCLKYILTKRTQFLSKIESPKILQIWRKNWFLKLFDIFPFSCYHVRLTWGTRWKRKNFVKKVFFKILKFNAKTFLSGFL